MNRNQARFVIGLVVVCVLGGLGMGLWHQRQDDQELPTVASSGGDQRMQNFRRVKMRDGKKIWEIAATQARFFSRTAGSCWSIRRPCRCTSTAVR